MWSDLNAIMHNPADFPDPWVFRPERYLSEDAEGLRFTPHPRVIPYGVGKHRCLGETLGRASLYLMFCGLLQRFSVQRLAAKRISEDPDGMLSQTPKPYTVRLVPRK